jgi:hypothetical protein
VLISGWIWVDGEKSSDGGSEICVAKGVATWNDGVETGVECALPSEQRRGANGFGAAGIMSYPDEEESSGATVAGMSRD